jgi:hypothetical protein
MADTVSWVYIIVCSFLLREDKMISKRTSGKIALTLNAISIFLAFYLKVKVIFVMGIIGALVILFEWAFFDEDDFEELSMMFYIVSYIMIFISIVYFVDLSLKVFF